MRESPTMKMQIIFILLLGYNVVFSAETSSIKDNRVVPNQLIIKFIDGVDPMVKVNKSGTNAANKMMQQFNIIDLNPVILTSRLLKTGSKLHGLKNIYYAFYEGNRSAILLANQISKQDIVEYAEPKYRHYLSEIPNDFFYSTQEDNYLVVHAPEAWEVVKGDKNIIIAIVDGGTDIRHEDLQANIWQNPGEIPNNNIDDEGNGFVDDIYGWNFANNSGDPTGLDQTPSNQDHGTHTAGIASAVTDNGVGVAGTSWNTTIMGINVSDPNEDSSLIWGYEGIIYAAENGAEVINCSWGRQGIGSRFEEEVIAYATSLGAAVVASAGNKGSPFPYYPSSYKNVLAVAGTDANDNKYSDSNYGINVDLAAPAVNIYSLKHGDEYGYLTGTSMATPMVAGAIGLVKTQKPDLEGIQAAEQVRVTTDPLPAYGLDLGRGRLNVYRALTEDSPSIRVVDNNYIDENQNEIIEPGESVDLYLSMVNFLSPASNVVLTLSTSDPYIIPQISQVILPGIGTMDTMDTDAFVFTVAENTPSAHYVTFTLTIESAGYSDHDYIILNVLPSFGNLDLNNIALTVTNLGRIGDPDPRQIDQSVGFVYKGGENLLYEGALITGASMATVSNAARFTDTNYDEDFKVVPDGDIQILTPGKLSDQESIGKFDDRGAYNPLPVEIMQTTYAWSDSGNQDYIIFLYTILNTGSEVLDNYYFGLFFDWDIDELNYYANMVGYENGRRLGFVYDSGDGPDTFTGVMALNEGGVSFRAIYNDPNDPNNPSWGLHDSFIDEEKWESISGGISYTKAGPADISFVIGNGPYSIPAKSVKRLAFAILAADDSTSLMTHADSAQVMWERLVLSDVRENELVQMPISYNLSQNYPNPFNPSTTIEFSLPKSEIVELKVYNILGKEVTTLVSNKLNSGNHKYQFDGKNLASGVYYYRLVAGDFREVKKMILLR